MDAWAHVKPAVPGESVEPPHLLCDHLRAVGMLAASFAQVFGSADWAELAGRWHDLGKYRVPFQNKLRAAGGVDAHIEGTAGRVTHSHAGALHAIDKLGPGPGTLLAFLIAGHHTGLPDCEPSDGAGASLKARLAGDVARHEYDEALAQQIPDDILATTSPSTHFPGGADGFALWLRMLFSCLVDADFLDT